MSVQPKGTAIARQPEGSLTMPEYAANPNSNANPADQATRILNAALNTVAHWWMIGIPLGLAVAAIACGYIWYSFEPQYQSSAKLLVRDKPEYIAFNNDSYSSRFLQTQLQLFRTRTILATALEDLGATVPELNAASDPFAWLLSRLRAGPVGRSEFVEVSFRAGSPEAAQRVVKAVVEAYLTHTHAEDYQRTRRIIATLEGERDSREKLVQDMQLHIRGMAGDLSAKDPSLINAENESMARSLQSRLVTLDVDIEVSRAQLEAERTAVPALMESNAQIEAAVAASPEVAALLAFHDQLEQKIADFEKAVQGDPKRFPIYQRYLSQLEANDLALTEKKQQLRVRFGESLRANLQRDREMVIRELENKIASLQTTRDVLENQLASTVVVQGETGGDAADLEFRRQELSRHEKVLQIIASRILALRTELAAPGRISRQDDANLPTSPVEQLPWKKLGMAICASLIAPFGLLFLWEQALQRVGDSDSLREANIRVIGEVATLPKGRDRSLSRKSPSLFEESVDSLRVGLQYSRDLQNSQVIALTSAVSGEGKTCLAAQLAVSIARARRETTLLIDADIRSPDVADIFEVSNSVGLTDVLDGSCRAEEAITSIEGLPLDVLAAGPAPKYLAQLIGGGAFAELISDLRTKYQHIIVDTPPLLAASEAVVFAAHADATLLCTMRNHSRGKQVAQAYEKLVLAGANPVGVVLNGVAVSYYTRRYGYYNYAT